MGTVIARYISERKSRTRRTGTNCHPAVCPEGRKRTQTFSEERRNFSRDKMNTGTGGGGEKRIEEMNESLVVPSIAPIISFTRGRVDGHSKSGTLWYELAYRTGITLVIRPRIVRLRDSINVSQFSYNFFRFFFFVNDDCQPCE